MVVIGLFIFAEYRIYVWCLISKITGTMSSPYVFVCKMAIITDCLIILVETITFQKVEFFIVIVITINVIKSLTKDLFKIKVLIIFIKTNIIKSFIISKNLFSIKLLFIIIKKNIIKSSTISRNLF